MLYLRLLALLPFNVSGSIVRKKQLKNPNFLPFDVVNSFEHSNSLSCLYISKNLLHLYNNHFSSAIKTELVYVSENKKPFYTHHAFLLVNHPKNGYIFIDPTWQQFLPKEKVSENNDFMLLIKANPTRKVGENILEIKSYLEEKGIPKEKLAFYLTPIYNTLMYLQNPNEEFIKDYGIEKEWSVKGLLNPAK